MRTRSINSFIFAHSCFNSFVFSIQKRCLEFQVVDVLRLLLCWLMARDLFGPAGCSPSEEGASVEMVMSISLVRMGRNCEVVPRLSTSSDRFWNKTECKFGIVITTVGFQRLIGFVLK